MVVLEQLFPHLARFGVDGLLIEDRQPILQIDVGHVWNACLAAADTALRALPGFDPTDCRQDVYKPRRQISLIGLTMFIISIRVAPSFVTKLAIDNLNPELTGELVDGRQHFSDVVVADGRLLSPLRRVEGVAPCARRPNPRLVNDRIDGGLRNGAIHGEHVRVEQLLAVVRNVENTVGDASRHRVAVEPTVDTFYPEQDWRGFFTTAVCCCDAPRRVLHGLDELRSIHRKPQLVRNECRVHVGGHAECSLVARERFTKVDNAIVILHVLDLLWHQSACRRVLAEDDDRDRHRDPHGNAANRIAMLEWRKRRTSNHKKTLRYILALNACTELNQTTDYTLGFARAGDT